MNSIEKVINHVRAYQYGEPFEGEAVTGKHSFDFTDDDAAVILRALEVMNDLAKADYPHNFQRENRWVVDYCYKMTAIQKKAKEGVDL